MSIYISRVIPAALMAGLLVFGFSAVAKELNSSPESVQHSLIAKKKTKKASTQIQWLVKPDNVEIHLDGKLLGKASKLKLTAAKPGMHTVRLVNGLDETEFDLQLRKNQTLRFEFTFEP